MWSLAAASTPAPRIKQLVLAILVLAILILADVSGNAANDGPDSWALATHLQNEPTISKFLFLSLSPYLPYIHPTLCQSAFAINKQSGKNASS